MSFIRSSLAAPVLLGLTAIASPAAAEGWMVDATAALGTGFEGGDPGSGEMTWGRARTRLVAGFDLRSDEAENDAYGFRAFAELEQRGGIGGEARYSRFLGRAIAGSVFATGTVAPETLFGGGVATTFMIPFGPRFAVAVEPAFAALPVGSDLPEGSVLLWATLTLGVRLGL